MSWYKPYKTIDDLAKLFGAMDEDQKQKLFQAAFRVLYTDRFYGGPFHGVAIDDEWASEAEFISCDYSESEYAIYAQAEGELFEFYGIKSKAEWDREPEPERKPDAFLEFFYNGDRWFYFKPSERIDFLIVDDHPCRLQTSELSGPWVDGLDDAGIANVLSSRLHNDIETVLTIRNCRFVVRGLFSYHCGGVEMERFLLCHEKGGPDA
jgi:hypothetical protein